MITGHQGYYAVHGNYEAVSFFRYEATRHWHHALKRRSQKNRLPWNRMNRLAKRWLPRTRITHPDPEQRFAASHPWQEPSAVIPLAGICAGGRPQGRSLPRRAFPASARDSMLPAAAGYAMSSPEAVFRNPAKLAGARRLMAEHRATFVEMFGDDLVVVPGKKVPGKVAASHRRLTEKARPGREPPEPKPMAFPDHLLAADSVAIHFVEGEGLSFYPDYRLLEELFGNPALISRRPYRETLSGFLRDPDSSPEPLRRLAARDPAKASTVSARLLNRKRGFSWNTDGEELLRRGKPSFFDGSRLPRTVPLSGLLPVALERAP